MGGQGARGRRAKAFKRLLETKLMGSFIPRFCCFIHTLPFTHTVASHKLPFSMRRQRAEEKSGAK